MHPRQLSNGNMIPNSCHHRILPLSQHMHIEFLDTTEYFESYNTFQVNFTHWHTSWRSNLSTNLLTNKDLAIGYGSSLLAQAITKLHITLDKFSHIQHVKEGNDFHRKMYLEQYNTFVLKQIRSLIEHTSKGMDHDLYQIKLKHGYQAAVLSDPMQMHVNLFQLGAKVTQ